MTDTGTTREIHAQSVGLTYAGGGKAVLSDVNFQVAGGEFVSLIGPSGCGKSTVLRLIAGLLEPTQGRLTVGKRSPAAARRDSHGTAFVFQEANLLPWRSVTGNIRLPLELQRVPCQDHAKMIDEVLRLIGFEAHDARKRPFALSGGMKMRVSLARALVTQPHLLLLDEPFAALDDLLRQNLNEQLSRIWQEQRWTGIFVTHNVTEAVFLSQRVLVMSRSPGRIAEEIAIPWPFPRPAELRSEPEFAKLSGHVSHLLRTAAQ